MTRRREFLARLGAAAATVALDSESAAAAPLPGSDWDSSWVDRLASARYRVVFNASDISDGAAMNYATTFLGQFHEVHDTADADTRPVIVMRRLGTPMAFTDAMWDRYPLGEDTKVNDPVTKAPARRNIFWKATPSASAQSAETTIEALQRRGLIVLVCNVSVSNIGRQFATRTQRDVEEVQRELKANLVSGAILVPSGIYALIRAQNAGCAYMPGT